MSIIHILDNKTDTILSTSSMFYNDVHRETLKNEEIFDFTEPVTSNAAQFLNKRNRVIIPVDDGFLREFIIEKTIQFKDKIEVYTSASYFELMKAKPIAPMTLQSQSVNMAVDFILNDSDWQRGITDHTDLQTIVFEEYTSPYNALIKVANAFELELRFRIETNNNRVTGRYVDLIKRRGQWRGKEIVSGKDLLNAKRTEFTQNIVTALIGIGQPREDGIKDVVTVSNEEARLAWGRYGQHLWGVYTPQPEEGKEMTMEYLTELTSQELQKRISSVVSYEIEGADIEHIFGREHEKVRLADSVRIKATEFNPPFYLDARIISREGSIRHKSQKKYVLGEFIEYTAEDIRSVKRMLEKQIAKKISESQALNIANNAIDDKLADFDKPVTDESFPDDIPPVPTNFIVEGLFKTIMLSWDFNPGTYIASYEVYGSQTQGFSPDENTLLWSGKTGGYSHAAETNQTWYFRIRAVNTHGTPSEFTDEIEASTQKILTDDMVFGEEMAAELRELSKTSQLLADGSISGDLEMSNGLLTVRQGAIGSAAIANGVISNYHLGTGIIDYAQIKKAVITDDLISPSAMIDFAKIANVEITNAHITGLLDANKIRGNLFQVGNGVTSTLLELYTDDNLAHYIKSNQAAGFRVESTGSLSLKAGSLHGIYATGAPLVAQNGFRVDGGNTQFNTDVYITSNTLYANDIWKNGSAVLSAVEAQGWFADINHSHSEYASSGHTHSELSTYGSYLGFNISGSQRASITYSQFLMQGTVKCTAVDTSSDINLKTDVTDYTDSALQKIIETPIVSYRYKDEPIDARKTIGIIAQIAPDEVYSHSDDNKAVSLYPMISLAWKAIQELNERIDTLAN